jgi:glycosyltransferase involved in cell wall biosynthesis
LGLSVVIPTYKNVEFFPELVDSIIKSNFNQEYEVLIGIDSCYDTLNYIYETQFPSNFNFFFFENKKGPYIIKNTLTELSKFDKILFFDSDDIMMPSLMSEVYSYLDNYGMIKPKYINFTDKNNSREFKKEESQFGEGVFGIRKSLFLEINGFEGWEVAADSDFMGRYYKTNNSVLHTQSILFHRRLHENSLTIHPDTGLSSRIRGQYHLQSKRKTSSDIVNEHFVMANYKIVDFENKILFENEKQINEDYITTQNEVKKDRQSSIQNILSTKVKVVNINTTPKTIDYNAINLRNNYKLSSQLGTALKKAKLEEIRRGTRR